jgi:hypothetical protein
MMQPPRNAPPADPRVARALDAVSPQHRATFRGPGKVSPRGPGVVPVRPAPADGASADAPDEGTILYRARRYDGTELRVSLHTFNGRPFARVGLWQPPRGGSGPWWPVKGRSVTVRLREALGVSEALASYGREGEGSADTGG